MYRLIKAASYIKENMPQGAPDLSLEDAYDVAAYMNSQARPIKANRDEDFPNRKVKPLDMDVGPYDDKLFYNPTSLWTLYKYDQKIILRQFLLP